MPRTISKGTLFFAIFALTVSLGCVRLGFWQLERLGERRARNVQIRARLTEAPRPVGELAGDTAVRFRRATASGRYDFENEFVLTSRSRNGSPGVHVITPLLVGAGDTAVLVNRGWVYAPDGMRIDLTLHREDPAAMVDGFVEEFAVATGPVSTPSVERAARRLDRDSLTARLPYPLEPVVLVQRADSGEVAAVAAARPVRVDPPPLDEGPHRAYAVQWFAFALVGVVGTVLVVSRDRSRATRPGADGPVAR
jgi:surfeit locus 1 family protein